MSAAFYENIVSPFVREFEAERSSVRRAYAATWALDSFASHLFFALPEDLRSRWKDDTDFKNSHLRPCSAEFCIVHDVSTAAKHAKLTRNAKSKAVQSSEQIKGANLKGWAAYFASVSVDDWGAQVVVCPVGKIFAPLLPIVLAAEVFLQSVPGRMNSNN